MFQVEVLREEDGQSSSGYSEEEGVLSHGEVSDGNAEELSRSPTAAKTGPDSEFVPPDDELKQKIISQVCQKK